MLTATKRFNVQRVNSNSHGLQEETLDEYHRLLFGDFLDLLRQAGGQGVGAKREAKMLLHLSHALFGPLVATKQSASIVHASREDRFGNGCSALLDAW